MQSRAAAGCSRCYVGMDATLCSAETTQLYAKNDATGSLVWLVEAVSFVAAAGGNRQR